MEMLIKFLLASWLWFATIMSLFWGTRSAILFRKSENFWEKFWWKSYEFIFNFVGSFAGWFCFYAVLIRTQSNMPRFQGFNGGDIILFVVSLLGLTGHLSQTIYGFVESFAEITKKVTGRLLK